MTKKHVETIRKINIFYLLLISIIIFYVFVFFKNINIYHFDYSNYKYLYNKFILQNKNNFAENEYYFNFDNLKKDDSLKNIKASSYVIYDFDLNKEILSYNANIIRPLASLSKIMTGYVAIKECKDSVKKDLDSLLIASDNDAAENIANNCPNHQDFVSMMNHYSQKNKLNLSFINPSGLDIEDETKASNFGDAVSVVKILDLLYLSNRQILSHTTKNLFLNIKNTNEYVKYMPFLLGSKTGYTDIAGGNLATLYEIAPGKRIGIVVLGSTKEDRFSDTFILLKSYLNNIK